VLNNCGTEVLQKKLSNILSEEIIHHLPDIKKNIKEKIKEI